MLEGGKIDSRQAIFLNVTMIYATAILVIPAMVAGHAKLDGWISSILAALLGLPIAWLTVKLSSLFPGKTLIEYLEDILGRWLGKILGFLYLFWFFHICAMMIREYGDFLTAAFMQETPLIVFNIVVTVLAAYTIKQGLEVLVRVNLIFLPLILFSIIVIFLLAIPQIDLNRLLPILESKPADILKGSMAPLAWFGEISTFAMLIPYLNRPGDAWKIASRSILIVGVFVTFTVVGSLATFGYITASLAYPVLNEIRVINIANIIERLEPIIMAIWVTGGFVKITAFYYVIVLGSAQWLKLRSLRPLIIPIGVVLVSLSIAVAKNPLELSHFLGNVWPFYGLFFFEAGLLMFLLLIALARKRGENNQ